jgi:hypothetical protein
MLIQFTNFLGQIIRFLTLKNSFKRFVLGTVVDFGAQNY